MDGDGTSVLIQMGSIVKGVRFMYYNFLKYIIYDIGLRIYWTCHVLRFTCDNFRDKLENLNIELTAYSQHIHGKGKFKFILKLSNYV